MMAIGERIRFFRNLRGMTQKYLGCLVGFPEKTADIRMAQYESGTRSPKADLTNKLAEVFGISPDALNVPDIDSYIGLMHTLFTLEDIYGLTIEERDGEIIMRVDPFNSREAQNLLDELHVWCAEREKYRNGEISHLICDCPCSYTCKHEFAAMLQLRETLEIIDKHYAEQFERTGYFAAINKGTLFAFAVDSKETGSFTL